VNKLFENSSELPSYKTRVRRRIDAGKRILEVILSIPRWTVKEQNSMAGVVCELRVVISTLCVADTHRDGV
jgi:hypothetical protein